MPELPEVETTVRGLNKTVKGLKITDVWSDYFLKTSHGHKPTLKNKDYFQKFRKRVIGAEILKADRRGKNVLLNLDNGEVIWTHLKMTGHFLYGDYIYLKKENSWKAVTPGPLQDPFNRFIHLVFSLSNGKKLVLSDVRRFAKVVILKKDELSHSELRVLGPNPLDPKFRFKDFKECLSSRKGPIKAVLMDQEVIAGIGNIYSDEMLWHAGIHPEEKIENITDAKLRLAYSAMQKVLKDSIVSGGDSTSDFRKINGAPGGFQKKHKVYRQKGKPCQKKNCPGTITRIVVRGRSSHFCPVHQKKVLE